MGTQEVIGRILDRVADQTEMIVKAHHELGISIESLLCAAIRRAASARVVDMRQEELKLELGRDEGRAG